MKAKQARDSSSLRAHAEKLTRQLPPRPIPRSLKEVQRLVHELQVHEAELMAQNEAVSHAQLEAEAARARYAELYDMAPVGYVSLDGRGSIREINVAAAALFGLDKRRLLSQRFEQLVEPASQAVYREFIRLIGERSGAKTCEISVRKKGRVPTTVLLTGVTGKPDEPSDTPSVLLALNDITQLQQAQAALRDSEEHFRLLIQDVKDYAIFTLDTQGYVTSWNAGAEQIKGYRPGEIIGRHFSSFYLGVDVARGKPATLLEQAKRSGKTVEEGWRVRKDGTRFWADVVITALRDEQGRLRGFSKVTRDVSERKRIEEELRESNVRFQAILEYSPAVIVLKDREGRYLLVNKQFETVFQVKRKDVTGKTDAEIFPSGQAAAYLANDLKVLRASRAMEFEEVVPQEDGPHTNIVVKFPVFDAEGNVSAICGISTDITERTRAAEALKQNERRTRLILDNAYDAFIAMDEQGVITGWNAQAEKIFGWRMDEALGKGMAEFIIPPQYQEAHRRGMKRFLETGEGPMLNRRFEITAMRRDGTEFPIELSISPLKIGGGYSFNAFIADISERIRWMDDLKRSNEQLLELAGRLESIREEERTNLAHEIHDELGQALTGLKLDLAWVKQQVSDARPELVGKLDAMAKLADGMVQSVRDIATDLRPVVLDELGLIPALEWCASEFQSRTRIRCQLNFLLRQVALDRDRATAVFRIFQEILTNIARHAKASYVSITARENAGRLVFEVVDDGRGITESEMASPKSLGLLGMRHRATLLKGKLEITGEPGKGTRVTVTVPFDAEREPKPLDMSQPVKVKRQRPTDKT